jgi:N-acetylglucosaminyldiphosphoundecaprenol N-acetyl-beta-D-mannosaminyltransferase
VASKSPRLNILGVGVNAVTLEDAVATMADTIESRVREYVCVVPAHSVMDCVEDPSLKPVFNGAGMCTPDGMAIVWLLKLHGYRHVSRVYGPDLMLRVCERSLAEGWPHFFLGGATGVAEELAHRLGARFPGLRVAGTLSPPFRPLSPTEDDEMVALINASRPDIVWVGLGSPKQEHWMAEHVGRIAAPVMVGVGAAFDFLSGRKVQAPRWVQRSGLEWLFRWADEPLRLFPRYVRYPLFAVLVAAQAAGLRHYEIGDPTARGNQRGVGP